ncbi:hypothetical protein LTR70_009395 [Exophiala xenobiotica]|uniref:Heterokaryon incompatibility domain-containing protein n=1 Tax=Lithohypha guttulata TaxID=1690604 RepID=A0ABR0JXT1_9EURO|nr:hypothetical protein LTR24_009323 [Lithohypha guttulata]KAK5310532.1 hypothetical protein LTR70_009395 [Exophiala xenobiotica]
MDLIPQMIKTQEHTLDNEKSIRWYRSTYYLTTDSTLSHHSTAALRHGRAVKRSDRRLTRQRAGGEASIQSVLSVSYTWKESECEVLRDKTFQIFDGDRHVLEASRVRDSIILRVLKYVVNCELPGFWIDKDCIDQQDEDEEQIAIQSMDLMYRFTDQPVAFLTMSIQTTYHARLLSKLMVDTWIWQEGSIAGIRLRRYVRVWQAQHMISMLKHLLSDRWWCRAWTYHEEFCASTKMTLLISHDRQVNRDQKFDFGNIPGEFKLRAVHFREQVTRFCLALMRKQGQRWQKGKEQCKELLAIAGQHKLIDLYKKETNTNYRTGALTWRVVNDLQSRRLDDPWEILAVIANRCGYSVRLDAKRLKASGYSLNAAVLALLLLNGEILHNENVSLSSPEAGFVALATRLSFRNFRSMVDAKEYTFLKRCRFSEVSLCTDGVLTQGYLWSLSEHIDFRKPDLSADDIKQLHMLCRCIEHKYSELASKVQELVRRCWKGEDSGRLRFMVVMARNIVRSIQCGESIVIGRLVQPRHGHAVFAAERTTAHSSTSWQPSVQSGTLKADRYLEKGMSLEVELVHTPSNIPRLTARRWVAGWWFINRIDPQQVLLPWPTSLEHLNCRLEVSETLKSKSKDLDL